MKSISKPPLPIELYTICHNLSPEQYRKNSSSNFNLVLPFPQSPNFLKQPGLDAFFSPLLDCQPTIEGVLSDYLPPSPVNSAPPWDSFPSLTSTYISLCGDYPNLILEGLNSIPTASHGRNPKYLVQKTNATIKIVGFFLYNLLP